MSLTTRRLHTLRRPSRAAVGLPISPSQLGGSIPHGKFKLAPGQMRAFSLASVLDASQGLVLGLHHVTGTPWCITIPMVAISVAAIFRLPSQIYTRKVQQQRQHFIPLITAWNARHLLQLTEETRKEGKAYDQDKIMKAALKQGTVSQKRIFKKAGLEQWKVVTAFLAGMPAWLIAIDSVRRIAGGPRGLIGLFAMDDKGRAEALEWEALPQSPDVQLSRAASEVDLSATASSAVDGVASAFDPSIMTEGCLWFTNLALADPYHILPYALSAVLVLNVLPRNDTGLRSMFGLDSKTSESGTTTAAATTPMRRGLMRSTLIISALIGPLTMDLPAAIHLYWITSAFTTMIMRYMVDKRWSIDNAKLLTPCKSMFEPPLVKPREDLENNRGARRTIKQESDTTR